MKKTTIIVFIIILLFCGWYSYNFIFTKDEVLKEVKTYLNKKEDAFLIKSEKGVYGQKMGTYIVNVRYKDEKNMQYTYAFDKSQQKVYLLYMKEYKNGKSRTTEVGLHDSMYFKDEQE